MAYALNVDKFTVHELSVFQNSVRKSLDNDTCSTRIVTNSWFWKIHKIRFRGYFDSQ